MTALNVTATIYLQLQTLASRHAHIENTKIPLPPVLAVIHPASGAADLLFTSAQIVKVL